MDAALLLSNPPGASRASSTVPLPGRERGMGLGGCVAPVDATTRSVRFTASGESRGRRTAGVTSAEEGLRAAFATERADRSLVAVGAAAR